MWQVLRRDPGAFVGALLIHGLVLALLVLGLQRTPRVRPVGSPGKPVIQAVAVNAKQVDREVGRLRKAEQARHARQAAERRRLTDQRRALKRQRERQAREAVVLKRRRQEAQRRRRAAEARLEAQRKVQAERLAKLKQQAVALQKRKEAEQQHLAELAAKRKREAEQQRRAAQARKRRQAAEKALQTQVAAEQRQVQAARAREVRAIVDRYVQAIKNQVEQNWLRPPGSAAGLSCTVEVELIPGGEVTGVKIAKGSGDPVFDRSVETAVRKASPLPMPSDPSLFNRFRDLTFVFKPARQGGAS